MPSFSAFLPNHWLLQQRWNGFIFVDETLTEMAYKKVNYLAILYFVPNKKKANPINRYAAHFDELCFDLPDRKMLWMNLCGSGVTKPVTHNGRLTMKSDLWHSDTCDIWFDLTWLVTCESITMTHFTCDLSLVITATLLSLHMSQSRSELTTKSDLSYVETVTHVTLLPCQMSHSWSELTMKSNWSYLRMVTFPKNPAHKKA